MRELWTTIALTSGAKLYSTVVALGILIVTARLLGPEGRGQVATITTWVSIFSTLATLSLGQVAVYRMSDDAQQARFGELMGSLILLTLILSTLAWMVAIGAYLLYPTTAYKGVPLAPLLLWFLAIPFLVWEQFGSSLLMGLDRLNVYNRAQVLGRTVTLVLVLALVQGLHLGVVGVVLATLAGQIVVSMGGVRFMLSFARSRGQRCRATLRESKALLLGGVRLHANAVGGVVSNSANVLIVNNYMGAQETGQFHLANQFIGLLSIIPAAACSAVYGKIATLGPDRAWPLNRRLLFQITIGVALLGAIAFLLAPWGIVLVAGEAFRPTVTIFRWMLPGLIGLTFAIVMSPQWIGRGLFGLVAGMAIVMGIINFALNYALIRAYGVQGAVYAYLLNFGISIIFNGLMAVHCERQAKSLGLT